MGTTRKLSEGNPDGRKRSGRRATTWPTLAVLGAVVVAGIVAAIASAHPAALLGPARSHHAAKRAVVLPTVPSSVQLYQWETSPSGGWITGNLGDHNSAYTEGQVIPFRLDVSSIPAGSYSFTVCRDFTDGGSPATYGYLRLAPFETDYTTDAGATTAYGDFNATSGISSLVGTDSGAEGACPAGHVETDVTFTTDGTADQFIYWGGYLAAPLDVVPSPGTGTVQFQHSAGFYPGSSLHMLLLSPSKDRSINPGSIIRLAEITATKVVDSGSAPPASWCFTIDSGPQAGVCETPNLDLVGSDGLNDSFRFLALPGGTYHITESSVTNYVFDHGVNVLNCPFTGSTAVPVVTTTTAGTTNATCEFHNVFVQQTPTISTTLKNAAGNATIANGDSVAINSSVYDTATVTAVDGLPLTGTVTFEFYSQADCGGSPLEQTGATVTGTTATSSTHGPLAAGSYGFKAKYVAGSDANHTDSALSSCEPFSVNAGGTSVVTTLKNAAGNATIANGDSVAINSSVYDTALVTAGDGLPLTGTVTFEFYSQANCGGSPLEQTGATLTSGVATSSTHGPLAAGSYGFKAKYVAGSDANHTDSALSSCEPFSVNAGGTSVVTTLKNAAGNATIANGDSVAINSSVYDTALVTAGDGLPLTGTVTFEFYSQANCGGNPVEQTGATLTGGVATSSTHGPLAAGSYGFKAKYVAGTDANHTDSALSSCEPFTVSPGGTSVVTTLHNSADEGAFDNGSTLPINSSVFDTAAVTAADGLDLTGTVSFRVFTNGTCTGEPAGTVTGIAVGDPSPDTGPLPAGDYGFQAMYVAGDDPNHTDSAWSDCEPFTIAPGTPSASTTLKNAADDSTVANGTALPANSSVYDTASVTAADGFDLTGTVTFRFFTNGACSGDPASVQTGVAVGGHSTATGALGTGSYSFQALYVAGDDPNHTDSALSACEPFSVNAPPVTPPPPPPVIDLAIAKSGAPSSSTVGSQITWTITVTNNGPSGATGVNVADPLPAGTSFVSVSTTQGTCTGGAIISCQLGSIAKGATVTITLVTTSVQTGTLTNTATVVGNEAESNTANNTASASVVVNGVFTPPVQYCTALAVSPKSILVGHSTLLTLHVTQHKQAKAGVKVRIKGPAVSILTKPSNSKGVVTQRVKLKKAGIMTFVPIAKKGCSNPRIGVIGVFTPPVTG